jgi:membrane protease YdiL (CAAX protease family)
MRSRQILLFVGYLVLLFASAIVRDIWLIPLASRLPAGWLIEPLWKIMFWLLPSWLYIRRVERKPPLSYWGWHHVGRGLLVGLLGCIAIAALLTPSFIVHHATFHRVNTDSWLNGVALVGVMEEIPFRGVVFGVLLRHSQTTIGKAMAFIISCTIFALIHVPLWWAGGLTFSVILSHFLVIWVVGAFFATAYWYSGSLWSSCMMHMVYDGAQTFFF